MEVTELSELLQILPFSRRVL